ncbi:het domain [Fusarium albosuccineum]|uniref:Het domain n=1 Tax=Fusarium albosuccineum TaxID=1237068 RepID=A0A8H4PI24_9HYPO|nr:het domain [Fusarium albosuccineum]
MRLLSTSKVEVTEVHGADIPEYAILSHTWSDEEILLQDVENSDAYGSPWAHVADGAFQTLGGNEKKGLSKMMSSVGLAARKGFQHIWIDTCCIDKTSSAELSEAINSMYQWYAEANICYAYLADVAPAGTEDPFATRSSFRRSRWFTRGWTLQELIASPQVEFFASDWSHLGSKNGDIEFTRLLNQITGIQLDVLTGQMSPQEVSLASRMHWAADRETTRVEDIAYCLLGIFDVNMPLLYGEGKRSFIRLQEAILSREEDQSLFAWHFESSAVEEEDQTWQIGNSGRLSGLLADSPARFWDNSDIEMAMPLTLTSSPPTVTSKGLGVDFLLLPCEDDQLAKEADFRVLLNCERIKDGQRESPVIYLKRIWGMGDQFARVRPDLKTFISPNISLLDGGTDERVFVKQDPSSDIKTIRVLSAKSTSQLQLGKDLAGRQLTGDWKIKDAWPKQGWDEQNQTFQTRNLTFGLPCGIFRLDLSAAGHTRTIDVAIGIHAPSERLCRSWCQIMTRDSFLAPESAYSWAVREAQSENITYNELSTQDIHGSDMSTWIAVTERNRRRGVDITLHVLSPKPHKDEEEQAQREDFGQIIPILTLSTNDLKNHDIKKLLPPPQQDPAAEAKRSWSVYRSDIATLMADPTVVDTIEISVFPRMSFGSKVRISSPNEGSISLRSVRDYCLDALPVGDTETRSCVQVLLGSSGTEDWSYLDASRILEGRTDSFLQLHPVHWAVIGAHVEILRTVLKAGLDAIGKSDRRLTTVHLAMLCETADVFNCLVLFLDPASNEFDAESSQVYERLETTAINGDYPLHFAAAYAAGRELWERFSSGVISGQRTNRLGEIPLHRACAMGNIAAVKYLTSNSVWYSSGWNGGVSRVDNLGRMPLWHAACSDYDGEVTRLLLAAGTDMDLPDNDGLAPAHMSCRQGTIGCLKKLKSAGANLNLPAGALGLLPMHFAAVFGHKRCIQILLRADASILTDPVNGLVVNALHLAVANGQEPCARAIWDSLNPKPEFRGWSPCIVLESSGPVLKWMHVEINDEYWFAIEDPLKEGGTKDFNCLSAEDKTPALWADPGLKATSRPEDGEDDDGMDDDGSDEETDVWRTDLVKSLSRRIELPGDDSYARSAKARERPQLKQEPSSFKHASRKIKSLFGR